MLDEHFLKNILFHNDMIRINCRKKRLFILAVTLIGNYLGRLLSPTKQPPYYVLCMDNWKNIIIKNSQDKLKVKCNICVQTYILNL